MSWTDDFSNMLETPQPARFPFHQSLKCWVWTMSNWCQPVEEGLWSNDLMSLRNEMTSGCQWTNSWEVMTERTSLTRSGMTGDDLTRKHMLMKGVMNVYLRRGKNTHESENITIWPVDDHLHLPFHEGVKCSRIAGITGGVTLAKVVKDGWQSGIGIEKSSRNITSRDGRSIWSGEHDLFRGDVSGRVVHGERMYVMGWMRPGLTPLDN